MFSEDVVLGGLKSTFLAVASMIFLATVYLSLCPNLNATCAKTVSPPQATHTPDPIPPESWIGKGPRQATSVIRATIDQKGKVQDPQVIESGGRDADAQALSAVREWRFKPAKCEGQPIEVKIDIQVHIVLR